MTPIQQESRAHDSRGEATSRALPKHREFAFSDVYFNAPRTLVKEHTGIALIAQKRELVYGRLSRRLFKVCSDCSPIGKTIYPASLK